MQKSSIWGLNSIQFRGKDKASNKHYIVEYLGKQDLDKFFVTEQIDLAVKGELARKAVEFYEAMALSLTQLHKGLFSLNH